MNAEDRELVWSIVAKAAEHGSVLSFGDAMLTLRGFSEDAIAGARSYCFSERESTCKCVTCSRRREGATWEQIANELVEKVNESLSKFGFVVMYYSVPINRLHPWGVDVRSKGLKERIGRELQLIFPLSGEGAIKAFHGIAKLFEDGAVFGEGAELFGLFDCGWPVRIVTVEIGDEKWWHVVLPDDKGSCDLATIDRSMAGQYAGVNDGK